MPTLVLTDEATLAADDTPQTFVPVPGGSHSLALSDDSDGSFVRGIFTGAGAEDWYRLTDLPPELASADGHVAETRITWRIAQLIKFLDGIGQKVRFEVYKSDKTTLVAAVDVALSMSSTLSPIDMPPVFLIGNAEPSDFPLYLRVQSSSTLGFSLERIDIARVRTQYMFSISDSEVIAGMGVVTSGEGRGMTADTRAMGCVGAGTGRGRVT